MLPVVVQVLVSKSRWRIRYADVVPATNDRAAGDVMLSYALPAA
jgi:hypothetical protein